MISLGFRVKHFPDKLEMGKADTLVTCNEGLNT